MIQNVYTVNKKNNCFINKYTKFYNINIKNYVSILILNYIIIKKNTIYKINYLIYNINIYTKCNY